MYNIWHLLQVARSGLDDMAPALRRAFNRDTEDDRLDLVFGARPRLAIAGITAGGIIAGLAIERILTIPVVTDNVNLSAVIIGAAFALLIRRYLFGSGEAREPDFPWLAASVIPAAATLVLVSFVTRVATGGIDTIDGAPAWTIVGGFAVTTVESTGVAAALTIAMAALCYRQDWAGALKDLVGQLIVFKVTVFIMVLLIVEIGIVGPILAKLLEITLGIRFPPWLSEFVDQLSYAGLMFTLYFAVVGATWMVCRRAFGQLLETGDAEILKTIKEMAETPKQREKREQKTEKAREKAQKKAEKKRRKAEKRKARNETAD